MQNVIPIVIEQQHVVAYADGATVLIDTGAPISYGDVEIQWRGESLDLRRGLPLYSLSEISRLSGIDLQGLIGADVLLRDPMTVDIAAGELRWGESAGEGLGMTSILSVPIAQVPCGSVDVRPFAVDTGATQTFLTKPFAGQSELNRSAVLLRSWRQGYVSVIARQSAR